MFRVLSRVSQQLTQPLRRAFSAQHSAPKPLVPRIPQPQDAVVKEAAPQVPQLPWPNNKALPKPVEPTPAPKLSHEDRVHNPSGVPINILSH